MLDVISIPDEVQQIGFCTDIHSHLGNLLKMVKNHPDVKHWFCAGDVVDMFKQLHDNQPALRAMKRLGIPSVTGNHDHAVKKRDLKRLDDEAKKYLIEMPFKICIIFNAIRISLYHATPTSRDYFISSRSKEQTFLSLFDQDEADIFILGHTHRAYQKAYQGTQFINPGALGVPEEVAPSYCILNRDGNNEIIYLNAQSD